MHDFILKIYNTIFYKMQPSSSLPVLGADEPAGVIAGAGSRSFSLSASSSSSSASPHKIPAPPEHKANVSLDLSL
jgi:hypothetical protein